MESIVNYMEPRDIYEKIGTNASELSEAEHGFICGLIKKYKPKKIVELGVSGGGTSILVLNCLQKLGLNDTKMYSVDLSETYHFNPDKKCGFQIDEAKPYLKNIDNHKLILGKILPEVIEDIAKDGKIDFVILDTTHYLPGELMDFAIAIPFLADNAVVVLDDTSFWFEGENRWAFATKFQCGFYSVMHHTLLGMKTAASCDGRYARTSLSNLLSPVQGMDKNGPTSVMNSINKISMDYMGNGGVLDMKFTPQFLEKQNHLIALRYLIETYFDEGGLEVQFNVVSKDTLIKAQKEPEKYGSLVVRVSGYSAYFVKLDKELQDEIIMRTENKVV